MTRFPTAATAFPIASPRPGASSSATAEPAHDPNVLPIESTLTFVLDGTISSASSRADERVGAHLKEPLVVAGKTVAAAGAPVKIRILDAKPAENPDIYGFVDIYFESFTLADGRELPLRAPSQHLSVNPSAGHESTASVENTVGDIFTPTLLLHVFRKGRNFTLGPGAEVHARTQAALSVLPNGTLAITTPAPLVVEEATPHSSFRTVPLATPNADFHRALTPEPIDPHPTPT